MLSLQMDTDSEYTKGSIRGLAGVKVAPVLDVHLTPPWVGELQVLLSLSPCLRLLEGEAVSVGFRSASTAIGGRLAIEHTVTSQSYQHPTGLVSQGTQEAMVAIAAISNDDGKATA
jgi:hypothetical protein